MRFMSRALGDSHGPQDSEAGYLYQNPESPWPLDGSQEELDALPADWLEEHRGETRVKRDKRDKKPSSVSLLPDGRPGPGGASFQYLPGPLPFCLNCRVYYPTRGGEFSRLSVLGTGGRSTATTVLSLSAIRQLQASELPDESQKLLSFTDNRQDASLQAGHLNDFVEVGQLRGVLYRALLNAGNDGLGFDDISPAVFESLGLELDDYSASSSEFVVASMRNEAAKALREVLAYRIFRDLERGWRLTAPNLEQVGLLTIHYQELVEVCANEPLWAGTHNALVTATPSERETVARVLLEHLRRNLAIDVEWLNPDRHEQLKTRSRNYLKGRWAIDEAESLVYHTTAYPRSVSGGERGKNIYLSGRSLYARFIRRDGTFGRISSPLTVDDSQQIIRDLLSRLCKTGHLVQTHSPASSTDVAGYRLNAPVLRWIAGDGKTPYNDPLQAVRLTDESRRINQFFRRFYSEVANNLGNIEAREHTAQVPGAWREQREDEFRSGKLPILYCSPTMELGVDIADLNIVNLRNVPPTPANYAQRSGRAGRGGQPALVFTYCTTGSSHDQYYFSRPEKMVAGIVQPRLDLANEDLVSACS